MKRKKEREREKALETGLATRKIIYDSEPCFSLIHAEKLKQLIFLHLNIVLPTQTQKNGSGSPCCGTLQKTKSSKKTFANKSIPVSPVR